MEVDIDHIHLLIKTNPNITPKSLVVAIKRYTTFKLWQSNFTSYIKKFIWNRHKFWSEGYFICTIGNAGEETIRKYIETQG